jgi:transposase
LTPARCSTPTKPHTRPARQGRTRLDPATLQRIRNHYLGAIAKETCDNRSRPGDLAADARTLIGRFIRYEDMILRFAVDLTLPITNNVAERSVRPVPPGGRSTSPVDIWSG